MSAEALVEMGCSRDWEEDDEEAEEYTGLEWLYLHGHGARDVDEAVLQAPEVILDYRIYP